VRSVIYSMSVSVDGYICGPDGTFDWAAPDEELHQFHNDQMREVGIHLLGRQLYETMVFWETADQDQSLSPVEHEFAAIWQSLPKVVFSRTLESVVGNTRLLRGQPEQELKRLRSEPGPDIAVGGAGLAAELTRQGLIDEYRLFVNPGSGRRRDTLLPAPGGASEPRARGDTGLQLTGELPALPPATLIPEPRLSSPESCSIHALMAASARRPSNSSGERSRNRRSRLNMRSVRNITS
jgi:dihydrofolate reductase